MTQIHERLSKHVLADGLPIIIDLQRSHDSYVFDSNSGKELLDCFSQFASMPLGWNHPGLKAQYEVATHKIANGDCYTKEYVKFVEKFAEWTPDHKYKFFISSGALAVENALKAAFDWKVRKTGIDPQKLDVIHLKNAFHGRSGYTLSLTNTTPEKTWGFPMFKWTRIECPPSLGTLQLDCLPSPREQAEQRSLEQASDSLEKGNVAAIIIEPIQGEGGDNHFSHEYLQNLRTLADRYDAMLIFDEVQTGFGTVGTTWAYQHPKINVMPDMICFGKKAQVCGFACNERIDEVKDNVFRVSSRINSTWGGDLVDFVRSTAIMEIMDQEETILNVRWTGSAFINGLRELSHSRSFYNVRGLGFMIAFDYQNGETRDKAYNKLSNHMLLLKSGPNSLRFRPPLTFSPEDVDRALEIIESVKV